MERHQVSIKFVSLCILILSFSSVRAVHGGPLNSYLSKRLLACATPESGYHDVLYPSTNPKTALTKRLDGGNTSFDPIIGVQGKIVERRPVGVLQKDYPDVFNMLLLAMEAFQSEDENDDLSYNRIAGIHGMPNPWQYPPEATVTPGEGYCTHNSVLFGTWHRPYLVLFEQVLHKTAVKVAQQFNGTDAVKYKAACNELRLPYWDWNAQAGMPDVTQQSFITVVKPLTGLTRISNPFYNYSYPASQVADYGVSTNRSPSANEDLQDSFDSLKSAVTSLSSIPRFNTFSDALESIHGWIHVTVGGDMAGFAKSPFDPIFWLHHCNVDRLVAIYQASHPGVYMTSRARVWGTLALGLPGVDSPSTPLFPFRHPSGEEWTSEDVKTERSIFKYGYAYPEVPVAEVNGDLRTFSIEQTRLLFDPDTNGTSFKGADSGVSAPTARLEWNCNVQIDSQGLVGSHVVNFYLGGYDKASPENSKKSKDNYVGSAAIFSSSHIMERRSGSLHNVTVPLTPKLVERHVALRPDKSVPKLADQLYWTLEKVGLTKNQEVPLTDLASLKVAVFSTVADYPEDKTKLPVTSNALTYYGPTEGKEGGLQPGEAPPVGKEGLVVIH